MPINVSLSYESLYVWQLSILRFKVCTDTHDRQPSRLFQATADARVAADNLVSLSLLQREREDNYVVHDLVLDFVNGTIKMFDDIKAAAVSRQVDYLGSLKVLQSYGPKGERIDGFFTLTALWWSLEQLSGDDTLSVKTYTDSLARLEQNTPKKIVDYLTNVVERLFSLQVMSHKEGCEAII